MNGNGIVQVFLGSAHLDGDAETLHGLVTALADEMDTDNLLLRASNNELVQGGFFVLLGDL